MEGHREVNLGEKIRDGSPRVCKNGDFSSCGLSCFRLLYWLHNGQRLLALGGAERSLPANRKIHLPGLRLQHAALINSLQSKGREESTSITESSC